MTIVFLHGGNVGGWMWQPQIELLPERHLLTPDLPGYGERYAEAWPGLAGAADDVAALIRERAASGRAHVVGLSLGGFVAIHLVHRHPDLVRSCTITGAALTGYSRLETLAVLAQVPLWRRRWYWAAQAAAFRIPTDERDEYVTLASRVSARTNREMAREVTGSSLPAGEFTYAGPLLTVTAEHETRSVRRSFQPLCARLPQTQTWIAPGMHHAWNVEDPALFTQMVTAMADTGSWVPPAPGS